MSNSEKKSEKRKSKEAKEEKRKKKEAPEDADKGAGTKTITEETAIASDSPAHADTKSKKDKKDKKRKREDVAEEPISQEDSSVGSKAKRKSKDEASEVLEESKEHKKKKSKKEHKDKDSAEADKPATTSGDEAPADVKSKKDKKEKKDKKDKKDKKEKKEKKDKKGKKEKKEKEEDTAAETRADVEMKDAPAQETADDAAVEPQEPSEEQYEKNSRFIVFVGQLPYTATVESISKHFEKVAPTQIRLPTLREDEKRNKGFCFLEFEAYDRMKTCLKLYHRTDFDDGISPPRKIKVELTAGGGGSSEHRKEKIRVKNEKLTEERRRRIETEAQERFKKETKEKFDEANGKKGNKGKGPRGGPRIDQQLQEKAAGRIETRADTGGIHPDRLAMMM